MRWHSEPPRRSSLAQLMIWVVQLVRVPACKAGDPGSNQGPGENFSLKLTTQDLTEGYSEK